MAITLSTIALHKAAFAPMTFTIDSDRMIPDSDTVTAIADDGGGLTACTISGLGNFKEYDVVLVAGGTGDYAYLNGYQTVRGTAVNTVILDVAYDAPSTGTKPTITRANTGVKEKVVITIGGIAVATFYVYPVYTDGDCVATVDIAPYIQGYFGTDFTLTVGNVPTAANHVVEYSVSVYEMHLNLDGTYYTATAIDLEASTGSHIKTLIAHRTAELLVCDGGTPDNQLMTMLKYQYFKPGDKVMVGGIFTSVTKAYVDITGDGITDPAADSAELTITKYHLTSVLQTISTTNSFNIRFVEGLSEGASWISERIYFVRDDACKAYPVTLYFLNRYGGFDIYHFKETASDKFVVEKWKNKTMQNVTATTREKKLIGRPETYSNLQILSDIISSPEVYDTAGARVYVKSSDMILKDSDEVVYPEITIEIFENQFING